MRASKPLCGIVTVVRVRGHAGQRAVGGDDDRPSNALDRTTPPSLRFLDFVIVHPRAPGEGFVMNDLRVHVIELRGSGGLGLFLRVGDDQRLYRVAPVRDPNQPRFWCLAAFECSSCGIPVTGTAIWAGAWGSAHHELSGLLDTIKADADAWLAEEECARLRELLQQPRPPLPLPLARTPRREAHHRPDDLASTAERAS